MSVNFSNTNTVWASILVETLYRLGLTTAIVCPGSRSAPLAVAFAQHLHIEAIPVLDERSASFFALGIARKTKRPVALICTSGTAGANFYPAIIEARESRIPLLVLTADRPPELRECNAGQTVDQQKLFGTYPNWYSEIAVPSLEPAMLGYLRQTVMFAWERSLSPVPGVVHLNLPFRDPLAPIVQKEVLDWGDRFDEISFFAHLSPLSYPIPNLYSRSAPKESLIPNPQSPIPLKGIIIAGVAQPRSPQAYCEAIAHLSNTTGFPVLAEALSPVRNFAGENIITSYDLILRNRDLAEKLAPHVVIRVGEMPTSKELRSWLQTVEPQQWVIDEGDRNLDPIHGKTIHLRMAIESLDSEMLVKEKGDLAYLELWKAIDSKVRYRLSETLEQTEALFEGKAAWLLSQILPPETPLFVANSMPVRDMEYFWQPGDRHIQPFFNRGANGIDGTLSTALGMAHRSPASVLLTGDLALLHDTNGFLLQQRFSGHLTIVLINNNGGGIFEMLPISAFDPPFEDFFATPQMIDFAQLCATYRVKHERISSWEQFRQRLSFLPESGIRVLELLTDRKADAKWRQEQLRSMTRGL